MNKVLTLDDDDPRVVQARTSEEKLFSFYGLEARSRYVRLPRLGVRVRVNEVGAGKPVVIVPGNTGDAFPLIPLMAQLRDRHLVAINRPGGGMSEGMDHRTVDFRELVVETITSVLDALAIDSAPVVAHSIGGHMSLLFAMARPERVSALALLGVPGNLPGTRPPVALRMLSVPVLNRLLIGLITPGSVEQSLRGLSFMGHSAETCAGLPASMAECYYAFQHLPHYRTSSLSLMESLSRPLGSKSDVRLGAEQLRRITQPTMFLWGTNDPFGGVEAGRQIAGMMQTSEFHAIPDGGHLPWLDKPDDCGRLARDFLSGC